MKLLGMMDARERTESVQPAVAVIERLEQRVISKVASDDLEARH